jgi:hypothetical protein
MGKVTHQSVDSDLRKYGNIQTGLEKLDALESSLAQNVTDLEERGLNSKKLGLKGDGVTNDSVILQTIITNAKPFSTIFLPDGTYLINSNVTIDKPLKIIGSNKTIFTRTGTSSISLSLAVEYLQLENIIFDGAYQKSTMVWLSGIKVLLKNCTFKNNGVPGFSLGNYGSIDGLRINGKEVYIDGCTFEKNERDGLLGGAVETLHVSNCIFKENGRFACANDGGLPSAYEPKHTLYTNNYVYRCGSGGLHVEGNAANTERAMVTFTGNTIDGCGHDDWGLGWGVTVGHYAEGTVTGNLITNFNPNNKSNLYAVTLNTDMGEVTISGNSFRNCKGTVINTNQLTAVDTPLVITGNAFNDCGSALFAYQHHNIVFTGNRLEKIALNGISVDLCNNMVIDGNNILNCSDSVSGTYSGIRLSRATYPFINGNVINSPKQKYGIEVVQASNEKYTNIGQNHISSFVTSWCSFANGSTKGTQSLMQKTFYNSAIPTVGTWNVGDIVYNTNPSATGSIGWVCVTSGTFGGTAPVFKAFGTIAS